MYCIATSIIDEIGSDDESDSDFVPLDEDKEMAEIREKVV